MFFEQYAENITTVILDGSTIFLLAGVYMQTGIMRKRGRDDDKLFFLMIVIDIAVALADLITYLADGKSFPAARYYNMAGVSVFYIGLVALCMIWLMYCMVRFKHKVDPRKGIARLIFMPGLIMEILLLINIFAGFVFSVDKDNVYRYGVLFRPMMVVMAAYVFAGFVLILLYRTEVEKKRLIPVWIYFVPLAAGIVVPFVLGGISLTSIGCAMSITFTHLGSASEMVNAGEV